jgi:DNA mismatch repair protein MutS2
MLKASIALEWPRFLSLTRDLARTEPGQAAVDALRDESGWAPDVDVANLRQSETQEATELLVRDALWLPLLADGELRDPAPTLDNLTRGSVLEIAELASLRGWIRAAEAWRSFPAEDLEPGYFRSALMSFQDLSSPLRTLERVLTPEGDLSENASPRLSQLHSELRGLKREISTVLDHLMKTFSQKGVLQENFTDVRDGRYVLPVKIAS